MSWADDQKEFMQAGDQTTDKWNMVQCDRYIHHVVEEASELLEAREAENGTKMVDALIDTIVVAIGALWSLGVNPDDAWAEVHAANMRKVINGHVCRRADGQIGKPPGWYGPEAGLTELVVEAKQRK